MFYEVLDKTRLELLPKFAEFKRRFYLAGGTALALQIGHRKSIDFDFFSDAEFKPEVLLSDIQKSLTPHKLEAVLQDKNTLTVIVDSAVSVSFFYYPYRLISRGPEDQNLRLASITDIGCMKLTAIVGRSTNKDYIDLYYILKQVPLEDLLKAAAKKMSALDRNLILKSLVYFEDATLEPLNFLSGKDVGMPAVEEFLISKVKNLTLQGTGK
ncbi:MAG: nucleotidyl transferase AbiEii/AbiGii toxin family protein [Candidatus Doudnabacteria bacterium]|nr:nucleotidyl transferase AbiEii/AbiGii toxin family protein [Candidatus Doudnabacteria bacterium]